MPATKTFSLPTPETWALLVAAAEKVLAGTEPDPDPEQPVDPYPTDPEHQFGPSQSLEEHRKAAFMYTLKANKWTVPKHIGHIAWMVENQVWNKAEVERWLGLAAGTIAEALARARSQPGPA